MLLASAYCPPVEYFALLARDFVPGTPAGDTPIIYIEACETYQKQSWRTRCRILGPNGVEMLQVPIVHGPDRLISEIRVDYSTPWIVRTERALDAAYSSSPFYAYYRDEILSVLEVKPDRLLELNIALTQHLLDRLGIAVQLLQTKDFALPGSAPDDYRETLHPKRPNTVLQELGLDRPYYQVFAQKFGFTPGLSVLDLLFNEGPAALTFLKR